MYNLCTKEKCKMVIGPKIIHTKQVCQSLTHLFWKVVGR